MPRTALSFIARCSAAALALAMAPAAAQAQSAPYLSASKAEAILGGQSRLAAIVAQQSGQPMPAPTQALAPAGYGAPVVRAVMPDYRRPAIATDRPDVFGSVALPISRSSLDRRWRQVARAPIGAAQSAYIAGLVARPPIDRLDAVNRYVNRRVAYVEDIQQYGTADRWSAGVDTLRRGKGDCEDYAIAKLQMLRRAGFADKDLYLVILRDVMRRADHAVLVARAEGRLLVLDNGTDRMFDSYEMPDYRPIVTFSGNKIWTHGYRREAPPVVLASSEVPMPTVTLAAVTLAPTIPSTLR